MENFLVHGFVLTLALYSLRRYYIAKCRKHERGGCGTCSFCSECKIQKGGLQPVAHSAKLPPREN